MKILMFGWEFPPYNSGGLGIACRGLALSLQRAGVDLVFVLPKKLNIKSPLKILYADFDIVQSNFFPQRLLSPYIRSCSWRKVDADNNGGWFYQDIYKEAELYAQRARQIILRENFDIIHCHDWLTLKAGFLAKELTKKPLVIHIHATEFDRGAGQGVDEYIYQIEREGVARADKVITVSDFVKQRLINNYGAAPEKIEVIHNAVDYPNSERLSYYDSEICKFSNRLKEHYKIVLFLGRLTIQKGPDYFVHAAKLVLEKEPKVLFVMVGDGDMKRRMIEKALYLGIAQNFIFTGFLKEDEVREIYKLADIYVMPSVSEPFGIAPLEALTCGTPVLISKQSGVSEVLKHCLSCDFWDTREMANKILACLKYSELHKSLQENGSREVRKFSWDKVAEKVMGVYRQLCPVTI